MPINLETLSSSTSQKISTPYKSNANSSINHLSSEQSKSSVKSCNLCRKCCYIPYGIRKALNGVVSGIAIAFRWFTFFICFQTKPTNKKFEIPPLTELRIEKLKTFLTPEPKEEASVRFAQKIHLLHGLNSLLDFIDQHTGKNLTCRGNIRVQRNGDEFRSNYHPNGDKDTITREFLDYLNRVDPNEKNHLNHHFTLINKVLIQPVFGVLSVKCDSLKFDKTPEGWEPERRSIYSPVEFYSYARAQQELRHPSAPEGKVQFNHTDFDGNILKNTAHSN